MDTSMTRDLLSAARHYIAQVEKNTSPDALVPLVASLNELANAIESIIDQSPSPDDRGRKETDGC